MPGIRLLEGRDLRRGIELEGAEAFTKRLLGHLEKKELRPHDFSLRQLAEGYMGNEWVNNLRPKSGRWDGSAVLREADGSAVAYSQFSNITGQIFFNAVKDAYEYDSADFPFSRVIPEKPTNILEMEKIPGISHVGDEFSVITEGADYPNFGVSEDYVEIAAKEKRGGVVDVTKEAVLGDRTGVLLDRCKGLGFWLKYNKEKRLVDMVIDENGGAVSAASGGHRYHWKGTSYATYQTTTPYDNVTASNALVDWTDIEAAWLTLVAITDPYTGEPLMQMPTHLFVTPTLAATAYYIMHSMEVAKHAGGYDAANTVYETRGPSPLQGIAAGNLQIVTSQLMAARAATDTTWYLGAPQKSFAYFSLWDVTPEEAPQGNEQQFRRDILHSFKVSEMGTAATLEPRFMNESTVA